MTTACEFCGRRRAAFGVLFCTDTGAFDQHRKLYHQDAYDRT